MPTTRKRKRKQTTNNNNNNNNATTTSSTNNPPSPKPKPKERQEPATSTSSSNHEEDIFSLDLRGCDITTPDSLQQYLKENLSSFDTTTTTTTQKPNKLLLWSIQTDQFPRGCMAVLLDHICALSADHEEEISIVQLQNHYGKVYKYQLQNPDLKLVVKTHGKSLTHLRMTPLVDDEESSPPPPPKLQGCGYRWITLYATKLQVLELSLQYDTKQQLLDFSRKTHLRVDHLREMILWNVGSNTTRHQLVELVTRAKQLKKLILNDVEAELLEGEEQENELGTLLEDAAKNSGNKKLRVQVNDE